MEEHVHFFSTPPSFDGLVTRCHDKFGWPQRQRGGFDYGKERAHYVLMSLACEDEWKNYIEVVKSCNNRCFEVVQNGCS
jgi:hypothetical protein